jgi:hypothetical protein
MTKITEFTKSNVGMLRNEIENAMADIAEKYGLSISIGNMSYSASKISAKGFGARILSAASFQDIVISKRLGFKESAYGSTFVHDGETFTITGLKPKNKRQIVAEGNRGNNYVFPVSMVFRAAPELKAI